MIDDKMKQEIKEKLKKMQEKWDQKEMAGMDPKAVDEMTNKAINIAEDQGMDAKGTMMLGKTLKMVGKAMIKEGEW